MINKFRLVFILLILTVIMLSNAALSPSWTILQGVTPTPGKIKITPIPKVTPIPLESQAGNTDLIVVLGILIVAIIISVLVMLWRRDLRAE